MKKTLITMVACLFVLGVAATANAVVLSPASGSVLPLHDPSPGGAFVDSKTLTYVGGFGQFTADVTETVRRNGTGLLFEYVIFNHASSLDGVTQMTALNYAGFFTSADDANTAPPHVDAMQRNGGPGHDSTITFSYVDDEVPAGSSSGTIWIQTDAKYYGPGLVGLIGGDTDTRVMFGPAVPEPASAAMLGMGLVGLVGSMFRRKFMA